MLPRWAQCASAAITLAACGGTPPVVEFDPVQTGVCGNWTLAGKVSGGAGRTLTLLIDDEVHQEWVVEDAIPFEAAGIATPGTKHVARLRMGKHEVDPLSFSLPSLSLPPALRNPYPEIGENQPLDFAIDWMERCPDATWTASLPSGAAAGPEPFPDTGPAKVRFPKVAAGAYEVSVQVDLGGGPVWTGTLPFVVGGATTDIDRDGVEGSPGPDCDDEDPNVRPGHVEAPDPNGLDDDCDGVLDEGTSAVDDDGDGTTEHQGDCDDHDPTRHVGAPEVTDCRDQDCDGEVDEGLHDVLPDDRYETNNERKSAVRLTDAAELPGEFSHTLDLVTSGVGDDEWFRFHVNDSGGDEWSVSVTLLTMGQGVAYEVEVYDNGDRPVANASVTGDRGSAVVQGRTFKDDSGEYWLLVRPVNLQRTGCPLRVQIVSHTDRARLLPDAGVPAE
jgi:hypothetical protein